MGGAFSSGQDNDELVDNLVDSGYIRSKKIEQVFRAVDRGDYFLSSHREDAYKDFAWKHGNIHLSAPCIYCEVMEELSLKPGLSFLNLGSGTGYLNTMAGLLLTQTGVNHGIELHEDCVKYAYDRLDEFKQKSLALDEFDFCEPVFVQGNCLNIVPGRRYDRVYCGATCPETHEALVKEFVKVGGILVMPYRDHLVKAKRVDENTWEQQTILPVSFANLVVPTTTDKVSCLPDCDPLSLQELCRGKIRRRLRHNVWHEHTDLETRKPICLERHRPRSPHRTLRQFVVPIFEDSDENAANEEEDVSNVHRNVRLLLNVDGPPGENLRTTLQFVRAVIHPNPSDEEIDDIDDDRASIDWPDDEGEDISLPSTEDNTHCDTNFSSSERERRDSESSSDSACDKSAPVEGNSGIDSCEGRPSMSTGLCAYSNMSESESSQDEEEQKSDQSKKEQEQPQQESANPPDEPMQSERSCQPEQVQPQPAQLQQIQSQLRQRQHSPRAHRRKQPASRKETADSGIVEDAACTGDEDDREVSASSDSELPSTCGTPVKHKRSSSAEPSPKCVLRSIEPAHTGHYVDTNAFSSYMKEKIHQLPLPYSLKIYMNYNRNL
ncbi:hypothetical protein QAD02_018647 [Eretmocerus hayati]|uniref:Uncharacterized protein n=1 Tax=Eretmocerus hayati TaxID=131215 RepID=A0ACC2PGZ4_9HYME|nr:hypothetical protein QAD02_018647 [Eretmocerus hayati]